MIFGSSTTGKEGELRQVALAEIDPNPKQPRRRMDDRGLVELAASIAERGILEPIIVTPRDGRYLIAAGERRFRAARMAGLQAVPCLVRPLTDVEVLELALIENLQREDLNAVDEAECLKGLLAEVGLTFEELGRRLGKTKSYVSLRLALLELPEEVQNLIRAGKLSAKHARFLMQLATPERQVAVARRVVADGLSTRQTQDLVSRAVEAGSRRAKPAAALKEKIAVAAEGLPDGARIDYRDDKIHLAVAANDFDRLITLLQRTIRHLANHTTWRSSQKDYGK